jgi:uncharacterized membrane protein
MSPQQRNWTGVAVIVYVTVFSIFTIERHNRFNSSAFDLAIQDQVVWNTAHGRFMQSSIETHNYLGDHISLTLPLFSLLYWIREDVRLLLIVQSLALGLSAIPLARLADRRLKLPGSGIAFALAFLLYPALGFINRFDFHPVAFVIPFFLFAAEAFDRNKNNRGWLLVMLALLSKEQIGLVIGAWGLGQVLFEKKYRRGFLFLSIGFFWSLMALYLLIPLFRGGPSDTLLRYGELAQGPGGLVGGVFLHPLEVLGRLFSTEARRMYIFQMLWPLGFLSLFSPRYLLPVLLVFFYNLLSGNVNQHSLFFQYNAPMIPFLFLGALDGVEKLKNHLEPRLKEWKKSRQERIHLGLVTLLPVLCLLAFLLYNPLTTPIQPPHFEVYGWRPMPPNAPAVREAAEKIPPGAELATTMGLAPHFAHREKLYLWWKYSFLSSEYILLNLYDSRWNTEPEDIRQWLEVAIREHGHKVIFEKDGIVLTENQTRKWEQDPTPAVLRRIQKDKTLAKPGTAVAFVFQPEKEQPAILFSSGRLSLSEDQNLNFELPSRSAPVDLEYYFRQKTWVGLMADGRFFTSDSLLDTPRLQTLYPIYTDFEIIPDGRGYYVLDDFGRVQAYGSARFLGDDRNRPEDAGRAVDLQLTPDGKGYLILRSHGVWRGFGQIEIEQPVRPLFSWDIARDLELLDAGSGYVLDGFGGLHSIGQAPRLQCSGWAEVDRMVDLELDREQAGWVLDVSGVIYHTNPAD